MGIKVAKYDIGIAKFSYERNWKGDILLSCKSVIIVEKLNTIILIGEFHE